MNKTPRTLEHCRKISDDALGLEYVANELQYWAEKLEKENTALREQLKDCSAVVDRQQEQLDRNAEQIAALRKDAERYQWLRTNRLTANNGILFAQAMGWKPKMLDAVGVDAAIDSAMKEEGK